MKYMRLTVGPSVFPSKNLTVFVKIKVLTQIETTQKNSAGWSLQALDDPPRKAPIDEEEDSSLYGQDKKPSPNQTWNHQNPMTETKPLNNVYGKPQELK